MAEFTEVMKQRERMCNAKQHNYAYCEKCGLYRTDMTCDSFVINHPQEAEEIIMKWAKENPIKTNADKFKEVFGYGLDMMEISEVTDGCILECEEYSGGCEECDKYNFWNKEYKEPKGAEK